jgi:rhodanese-related sulfurtransferase
MTVLDPPPAAPADAVAFLAARLAVQTDVADVAAALDGLDQDDAGPGFVLVDSRGDRAWDAGRVPGAVHLPTARIPGHAARLLDPAVPVVTYCWGPGCDGATRAALALARQGYRVKEMIGGFEYWVREGLPVQTSQGVTRRPADELTAPPEAAGVPACDC